MPRPGPNSSDHGVTAIERVRRQPLGLVEPLIRPAFTRASAPQRPIQGQCAVLLPAARSPVAASLRVCFFVWGRGRCPRSRPSDHWQADGSRQLAECDEGAMQTGLAAHKASLVGCHRSLHEVQHVIAIHGLLQHSHDSQRDRPAPRWLKTARRSSALWASLLRPISGASRARGPSWRPSDDRVANM